MRITIGRFARQHPCLSPHLLHALLNVRARESAVIDVIGRCRKYVRKAFARRGQNANQDAFTAIETYRTHLQDVLSPLPGHYRAQESLRTTGASARWSGLTMARRRSLSSVFCNSSAMNKASSVLPAPSHHLDCPATLLLTPICDAFLLPRKRCNTIRKLPDLRTPEGS